VEHITHDSTFVGDLPVRDTRFSASFSDSLALQTKFRISLFGFIRTVQSNLKLGDQPVSSKVFPSLGFSGTIGFSDAVTFTASYHYAEDRAALSPSPDQTYQLRNLAGFLDLKLPAGENSYFLAHLGVMDRTEPEGIIPVFASDSVARVAFSNQSLHTQSATVGLDAYLGHFHGTGNLGYFAPTKPISDYTTFGTLSSDLLQRLFGNVGFFYENEILEGNLRISFGARMRFLKRLEPQLSYDRASDYYVYRGRTAQVDSMTRLLDNETLTTPKGILDVLLATEVDRRAQVNMEFLNILGTPYYNTSFYPRTGFHWRIDVTWAFLD
jgi:hypothetical protein